MVYDFVTQARERARILLPITNLVLDLDLNLAYIQFLKLFGNIFNLLSSSSIYQFLRIDTYQLGTKCVMRKIKIKIKI